MLTDVARDWTLPEDGARFLEYIDFAAKELAKHTPTESLLAAGPAGLGWSCACGRMKKTGGPEDWRAHVRAENDKADARFWDDTPK